MYVCSCFGITEADVRAHAENGAVTPRKIASACKAGTDCGGCVRRIQALLGRGACPRREAADRDEPVFLPVPAPAAQVPVPLPSPVPVPAAQAPVPLPPHLPAPAARLDDAA
ncbi:MULTISPECIES: (2Fe-2S)-binding protein [unclassified Streptomyces]|uniref:(2Fe-2S)-binding protein n=1 Tax=unclassified Streptomyces TaxID=2593676 RepID=UPI000BACB715|nr:(2Fe-2S)-binding protein [Streptomyces sp. CLI2509]ASY35378.1 (2Fe-2S)-binding protein [Streptomyces sp. CLI2509]MYX21000.1 (2Fe-2S)-binding protein [Streptomyces sp. SID8380]